MFVFEILFTFHTVTLNSTVCHSLHVLTFNILEVFHVEYLKYFVVYIQQNFTYLLCRRRVFVMC
jgi:hypothetical protein